jgi:hypothetical protein
MGVGRQGQLRQAGSVQYPGGDMGQILDWHGQVSVALVL